MKRKIALISGLAMGLFFSFLSAQVVPVVSTLESPIWYSIESAAVTSLGSPNTTVTGILPLKDKGYVLYSPTVAGKINYRISTGTDVEKWAIVSVNGYKYLLNKGTGLYMRGSHSAGAYWANDSLRLASLGSGQYSLRTSVTEATNSTTANNSYTIAWNSLICDRWNVATINTITAWIFKAASAATPKADLGYAITAATTAKSALISDDPGYIAASSQTAIDLTTAIATAQAVYNSTVTDAEYTAAKTTLEAAVTTFNAAQKNPIIVSSAEKDTWYYLVNGSDVAYCAGKVIATRSTSTGTPLQFTDKKADPNMLWKMVDAGNGKYGIQNRASGNYISTTITAGTQIGIGAYDITSINSAGRFKINAGSEDLHPQQSTSNIVNWNEDGTFRSTWRLNKLSDTDAAIPMSISQITVQQGRLVTGIGNKNFALIYFSTEVSGFVGTLSLESVKMNLNGTTNMADLENLRVYKLTNAMKFDPSTATQVASGTVASGDITLTLDAPLALPSGNTKFCIVVDIKETAKEGNLVDASLLSMKEIGGTEKTATTPSPANSATIFLTQSLLFTPGDYNSVSYRIPSIVTAKDGSLITSTDKRNFHSGDLAADIDQYVRRSTDNGKTWSDVLMTCGASTSLGYGDPALVVDRVTGKIICLVVHDKGFFSSTASATIKVISMESDDNGITWSAPKDITNQLYGAGCSNSATQNWAGLFISSGRGLQLRSGRIMFAGVVRNGVSSNIQSHSVYTDDLGLTWKVGTNSAINGGDESKYAERNNGDILISIRKAPKRYTNVSTDKGMTWGTASANSYLTDPACNGEILAYTSTLDGFNKNRMLQSLCYASSRTNVSMLLSYDEGITFPIQKTICAASSAYSTFTILPDGTIGMYFEDGSTGNTYDMVFVRFSLNWLTNGVDPYVASSTGLAEQHSLSATIEARVENGKILLSGTNSDFQVFNLSGMEVSKKQNLKAGVYMVKVDDQVLKVVVR